MALLVTSADAATRTYEGSFSDIGGSSIEFTVGTKRVKGKQVQTLRRVEASLPGYCSDGEAITLEPGFSPNARLTRRGGFAATVYQRRGDFGAVSTIRGGVSGPTASGELSFAGENPLFGSCSTGLKSFFANRAPR